MDLHPVRRRPRQVALLAEGVDRNKCECIVDIDSTTSPSSRRAWIEIIRSWHRSCPQRVALLAEGVDRNLDDKGVQAYCDGRPPRGGRG